MPLPEEVLRRLWHILESGRVIGIWTRDHTFDAYKDSSLLRSAVERRFMIIGEALRVAAGLDSTLADSISNVNAIIAFRHVLVHGYATVNDDFIWAIIHDDLPLLLAEVRALLGPSPA